MKELGKWLYMIGMLLAVLFALVPTLGGGSSILLLVIVGIVVGLLNVTAKESVKAMLAIIALPIVTGIVGNLPSIGSWLGAIFTNIATFAAGVAVPVVILAIHDSLSKK